MKLVLFKGFLVKFESRKNKKYLTQNPYGFLPTSICAVSATITEWSKDFSDSSLHGKSLVGAKGNTCLTPDAKALIHDHTGLFIFHYYCLLNVLSEFRFDYFSWNCTDNCVD